MALTTSLVPSGIHHSRASGNILAGAGFGEVAGVGAAQLCRFLLPYPAEISDLPGFQDQFYINFQSTDGNVTAASLDAQQFETDPATGLPVVRFRLNIAGLPAAVDVLFEAHHSAGR